MSLRRGAGPVLIERSVLIHRPLRPVVAAFRGDPEGTPDDVTLLVDEPLALTWRLARRGLRGSLLSVHFAEEDGGTRVTSRFVPRLGGLRLRLRRLTLTRRYEEIVEGVLERSRQALEEEAETAETGAEAGGTGEPG